MLGCLCPVQALAAAVPDPSARHAAPGTRFPPMKISFADPLTQREVWRMTTDGARSGAENFMGDLSSEAQSWSPEGRRLVYGKRHHPAKPDGVYLLDVLTGEETFLAPSESGASAVFSRSSAEVFYAFPSDPAPGEAPWVELRAVDLGNFGVRTLMRFEQAIHLGPAIQNRDGSLLAAIPLTGDRTKPFEEWSEQAVVMRPDGTLHPNWHYDPGRFQPGNADFAMWSPVDPAVLLTRRFISGTEAINGFWHVDTLASPYPKNFVISHASWHPNGTGFLRDDYHDLRTGQPILHTAIGRAAHPHINPADGAHGLDARVVFDGSRSPLLFVQTLRALPVRADDRSRAWCLHYSSSASHRAHVHPHWSPDGRLIAWQSDVRATELGAPPGGTGSAADGIDLFVTPVASSADAAARTMEHESAAGNDATLGNPPQIVVASPSVAQYANRVDLPIYENPAMTTNRKPYLRPGRRSCAD